MAQKLDGLSRFTGSDFSLWQFQFMLWLGIKDLEGVLEGSERRPGADEAEASAGVSSQEGAGAGGASSSYISEGSGGGSVAPRTGRHRLSAEELLKAQEAWDRKDKQAFQYLCWALEGQLELLKMLIDLKGKQGAAAQAWKRVQDQHLQKGLLSILTWRKRFYTMERKYGDGETMVQYLQRVDEYVRAFEELNYKVDEKEIIYTALQRLDQEANEALLLYLHLEQQKWTKAWIWEVLVSDEARKRGGGKKKELDKCLVPGCNRKHSWKEFWSQPDGWKPQGYPGEAPPVTRPEWVERRMKNGAWNKKGSKEKAAAAAANEDEKGKEDSSDDGTITVKGKEGEVLNVKGVLHVPGLAANRLSCSQLAEQEYICTFTIGGCTFRKGGAVVMEAKLEKGLYLEWTVVRSTGSRSAEGPGAPCVNESGSPRAVQVCLFCNSDFTRVSASVSAEAKTSEARWAAQPDLFVQAAQIAYAMSELSKVVSCPKAFHLQAAKRVLSDADYAGDSADCKSHTGYVYCLNGAAISWQSKRLPVVAFSTTEIGGLNLLYALQIHGLSINVFVEVAGDSGAARGAAYGGAASRGAEPGGAESEGAWSGGADPGGEEPGGAVTAGVEPGGAASEGADSGGAEPQGSASAGGPAAAKAGDPAAGDTRAGGAGVTDGADGTGGAAAAGPGGARTRGTGAARTGGVGGAGAGDPTDPGGAGAVGTSPGGARAGRAGASGAGAGGTGAGGARAGGAGAVHPGAGGAGAGGAGGTGAGAGGAGGTGDGGIPLLQPASPLPTPSPYFKQPGGLTKRREPASHPASPVHTGRLVPRACPPPVPGTHAMALRPSSIPLRVPLLSTVARLLATAITDPSLELLEDFEFLAAAVPHFASMLLAPEGDPDAPDIPIPRSYAEAIMGPSSYQWQTAMDAEMASWKSTGTYVDEVPPPEANIVDGMWIFRGVDYFQTFSPTPKMTTLRVLLHVVAQRDYELHSLEFSTTFLQGSLKEEIWLRRPPGFTGTTLTALGFTPSTADPSLLLRAGTSLAPFNVLVYVEHLVFATADTEALTLVKSELQKRCTCTDLGELRSYLGLQITRDRARHTITLTQSHMVHQSIKRSGPYPELVGCLMYLMTCTRPDLAYPLSLLARYVAPSRHRKVHWDAAKRVLRSSCEAEIYAGAMAAQELRWLTYLLTDLGEQPRSPLQRGQLRLAYEATRANTVDIFTKALPPGDHQCFSTVLGLATGAAGFTAYTPLQLPPFSQPFHTPQHPYRHSLISPTPSPHPLAACAAVGERGGEAAAVHSHPPPPYPPPHCCTRSRKMEEKGGRGGAGAADTLSPTAAPVVGRWRRSGGSGGLVLQIPSPHCCTSSRGME
ncbi:unnamed protein product [Closterium sp. NIES-53]